MSEEGGEIIIVVSGTEGNRVELASLLAVSNERIVRLNWQEAEYNIPVGCAVAVIHIANAADSKQALNFLTTYGDQLPVVVVSGLVETARKYLSKGAQEYLEEEHLTLDRLRAMVEHSILRFGYQREKNVMLHDYTDQFKNGPIPMWIVDWETMKFLRVNKAAVKKYGYSEREFGAMTLEDIRPKEDHERLADVFKRSGPDFFDKGYWRHIKKNGEMFWVHVYSHKTTTKKGESVFSIVVDVNDKIQTQQENEALTRKLREQKEELDNILFSISDAIWSRNAESLELIYANRAYFNLFGFTEEEVRGDTGLFFKSVFQQDREKVMQSMLYAKTIGWAEVEFRYHHKDNTLKTLQTKVTYKAGNEGEENTLNGVTTDITEARWMEDRIRQSEQNLLATINNTKDLIWSVNRDLNIIFCNVPYQEFVFSLAGVTPMAGDYVLGEWGSEAFIQSRTNDYIRALNGESFTTVVEDYYDGDILCKEFSNNPIFDHTGKIIGVNCIARDVSEQKRQMIKIQEQNEKLKEIAFIQSHNVRGPVASILGLTELFMIDPVEDEHNAEILKFLKVATNNLDNIIREIVEKTRILKKLPG